jgi:uncharacterized protein YkwD
MRRLFLSVLILSLIAPVTASVGVSVPAVSARQQDQVALDTIAAINAWRIQKDLWPFKRNATLDALALLQANYLLTLPDLPEEGNIHIGPHGEGPKDRAIAAPYNWPTYGRPDQVAEEEIAYAGANVKAAIQFWQTSTIHQKTVENPAYREIGIAVLPQKFGHLFIVEVGARPNILPALVDRNAGLIYLTNESFSGAARSGPWMHIADRVRLFDSEGKPLNQDWIPWQPTLPLPGIPGDRFFVAYASGSLQSITEVRLNTDVVLLPGVQISAPAPTSTPLASPTSTQAPTALPPTAPSPRTTPIPTATLQAGSPAVSTPVATPTTPVATPTTPPSPTTAPQDIVLVYDNHSLALVNTSGRALDLTSLVLVQGTTTLPVTSWATAFLNVPLTAFPARDCLQVWSWAEPSPLKPPAACRIQRAVLNLAPDRLFWTKADFQVRWKDTTLGTCHVGAGQCGFALPSSTP